MDIQRPSNARAKKIRRIAYGTVALLLLGGVTYGLSKLRPAAPSVDKATIWPDEVKRGPMLREVRGLGTLVPEDIRWIAAQTDSRVDRWVLRPGAIVKPSSIIMELSDPILQQTALDAEFLLKGAEADYANLKVQVDSELMNQKATEAQVRSDYEQAKIQHEVDAKLLKDGLTADVTERLSRVREQQLAIRAQLEGERTRITADSSRARLAAQQAKIDQQKALYQLKKTQLDALHVRAGIDGVLQLVPVEVGQHITPGTNLARVADPKKLKAEIKIAETQAKDVTIGQKATIDTRNGIVSGHVSRIDPSVVNGTVTVDVTRADRSNNRQVRPAERRRQGWRRHRPTGRGNYRRARGRPGDRSARMPARRRSPRRSAASASTTAPQSEWEAQWRQAEMAARRGVLRMHPRRRRSR